MYIDLLGCTILVVDTKSDSKSDSKSGKNERRDAMEEERKALQTEGKFKTTHKFNSLT